MDWPLRVPGFSPAHLLLPLFQTHWPLAEPRTHPASPSQALHLVVVLRERTSLPQCPLIQEGAALTLPYFPVLMFIASGHTVCILCAGCPSGTWLGLLPPPSHRAAGRCGRNESRPGEEGGRLAARCAPTSETVPVNTWQVLKAAWRPKAQPVAGKSCDSEPNFQKFLPTPSLSAG